MNYLFVIGLVLVIIGVVGYGVGVETVYPGRALSVTALMFGITLLAIKNMNDRAGDT